MIIQTTIDTRWLTKVFISDIVNRIGFEMREEAVCCPGIQGLMGNSYFNFTSNKRGGASHQSSISPEEFVLTFAPTQR